MKVEVLNKLRVAVGILLTILIQPSLHSETVRVGPNGKLITDSEDKVGIGSDGKLQNRYSKGSDSLYKSNIDESIFSYGNDLLKKCGESNSNADGCLTKFKDTNLEFSGKVKESKKGLTIIELDNNELVDVTAKEVKYYPNGTNVKFSGKIKSIGTGRYVHHSIVDAEFQ